MGSHRADCRHDRPQLLGVESAISETGRAGPKPAVLESLMARPYVTDGSKKKGLFSVTGRAGPKPAKLVER
jgi:hypothetical protein